MAEMIRKQVYIQEQQEKLLKGRAKALRTTEAELVRRGLELVLAGQTAPLLDPRAWDEELAFIHRRAKIKVKTTGRTWTREELYEDRLSR